MSGTRPETIRRNERVTSDLDIWRAAQATIARYGDGAPWAAEDALMWHQIRTCRFHCGVNADMIHSIGRLKTGLSHPVPRIP